MQQNKLIFLDTETTGRGPEDRMIQLCLKLSDEHLAPYNCLFKPPIPITYEAMAVHHITNEAVANLEPLTDTGRANIQSMLNDHIVVAHNAQFDIDILARDGIKVGKFIDTLKVAQFLWDEPNYKLQYLRYRFNLQIGAKAHDAEGDVAVLEALFNFLYKGIVQDSTGEEDAINKMIGISSQPILLRRMPFGKHSGVPFDEVPKEYISWLNGQKDLSPDLKYTLEFYLKPKVEVEKQARLL